MLGPADAFVHRGGRRAGRSHLRGVRKDDAHTSVRNDTQHPTKQVIKSYSGSVSAGHAARARHALVEAHKSVKNDTEHPAKAAVKSYSGSGSAVQGAGAACVGRHLFRARGRGSRHWPMLCVSERGTQLTAGLAIAGLACAGLVVELAVGAA